MTIGAIPRRLVAAHLAILAVAPLCLFPFVAEGTLAKAVLWLSGFAFAWSAVLVPSRGNEIPPQARVRFLRSALGDLAVGVLLVLAVLAGIRLVGEGVAFGYNVEVGEWCVTGASDVWPCAAVGKGFLPFAAAIGILVLSVALLHACEAKGRATFLNVAATLSGLVGLVFAVLALCGNASVNSLVSGGYSKGRFIGVAFGIWTIVAVWRLLATGRGAVLLRMAIAVAVFGNALGLFLLSPTMHYALFAAAAGVLAVIGLVRTRALLALVALAFLAAPLAVGVLVPDLKAVGFPGGDFYSAHAAVGSAALAAWRAHPWIGSGVGTFDIDMRLFGTEESWQAAQALGGSVTDALRRLLAERGAVGFLLPIAVLVMIFSRTWRVGGRRSGCLAGARLAATSLAAAVVLGALFDASVLWIGTVFSIFAVLAATTETTHG